MFVDAREVERGTTIEADVCIVGAGAAGITLAKEFAGADFTVCLLESGGLEFDIETNNLNIGKNTGQAYQALQNSRMRFFGGSTNHWEGVCGRLDPIDFEARGGMPYSGWPIRRSDLETYYERAHPYFRLSRPTFEVADWETDTMKRFLPSSDRIRTKMFQVSQGTRFGQVHREAVDQAHNVTTYLYANVVDIEANETADHVTRLKIATLNGNQLWAKAKQYVLATGGIENARILLMSNEVQSMGLGNEHDVVGRFFMEHPHSNAGLYVPRVGVPEQTFYSWHDDRGTRLFAAISPTPETMREEGILNFYAELAPLWTSRKRWGKYCKTESNPAQKEDAYLEHIARLMNDDGDPMVRMLDTLIPFDKDPPLWFYVLKNRVEQSPNPDSRIILSSEMDALDCPRVKLNWQLSELDQYTMRRVHHILAEEIGRVGLGRFRLSFDEDDGSWGYGPKGGSHHMGTTRMSDDPKHGVVNRDCRMHGVNNLFVAGSSVFPTSGCSNPTLTLVALAIRMADHVKEAMA